MSFINPENIMPVAKTVDQIPFDTLKVGEYWSLIGFTDEMTKEACRRLRERAEALGHRAIYRAFPSPQIFLGWTPGQLSDRTNRRKENESKLPPGRPVSIETKLIAGLSVGERVTITRNERHPKTVRNLAASLGRELERRFCVSVDESGEEFTISRLEDKKDQQRGRPLSPETIMLSSLSVGDVVAISSNGRHEGVMRNIASRLGKRLGRKFSVRALEGDLFEYSRKA